MTSLILSLFILVNIASLLASPINDADSIFSINLKKNHHRRSISDNRVESSKEDASELRCSDFSSAICRKKDFGIFNHYDLKESINEQIKLFMKPLNYLLNENDGKTRIDLHSFEIEQQLYHSCMNLGKEDNTEIPDSTNEEDDDNQDNEDEDYVKYFNNEDNGKGDAQYVANGDDDNDVDASLEEDVKELTEEMKKIIFDLDKNVNKIDSDESEELLGELAPDDIESEDNIKTAHEIVRDRFNDIFSVFDNNIHDRFKNNLTWQELDQYLEHYGFGNTFFNIRVATSPTNPRQNIIVLEPPSIDDWNSKKLNDIMSSMFVDIQKEIYRSCNFKIVESAENIEPDLEGAFIESNESSKDEKDNQSNAKEMPEICTSLNDKTESVLEQSIVLDQNQEVIIFYTNILKYIFDAVDGTVSESSFILCPLNRLNSILGYTDAKDKAKIDWSQIVTTKFKQLNISLADNEIILIRNQPYFKNLKDDLPDDDNNLIVHAILSKFIAENIRYHDWKKAYSLYPAEKSTFCKKQTKLYGISNLLMMIFQEKYMKSDKLKAERILHNLVNVFYHNISKTDITTMNKVQFKSELKAITRNVFRELNKTLISNFYEDFNLTKNYFVDIINYNNLLRTKNLRTLRDTSLAYENIPFSINEMDNPRNRFILHAMSDFAAVRKLIPQSSAEKEIYYATYGVNMASFLYSLLREEKFGFVDIHDRDGVELLFPRNSYSPETIKCFIHENIIDYGYSLAYSTITDIYGVRFAHAALLNDPKSNSNSSETFIKAFAESQCSTRNVRKVKKVLSQIEELPTLFSCTVSGRQICDKSAFHL